MSEKLPEWPETPPAFIAPSNALESALITETRLKHYEHARAEAAIARLRYLIAAASAEGCSADSGSGCGMCRALALIGEVPSGAE